MEAERAGRGVLDLSMTRGGSTYRAQPNLYPTHERARRWPRRRSRASSSW
ncbi:MAG: hypothetical protein U0Z44_19230 [Kouleothrix sp.]